MNLWITCCHMPARVMHESRECLERTVRLEEFKHFDVKVFIDHHYPLERELPSRYVREWSRQWGAYLISPAKNLGGHGGVSWACELLRVKKGDIVFTVDPDSCPATEGWVTAMFRAFENSPRLGSISLMLPQLKSRLWAIELGGLSPRIGRLDKVEMFNVTAFRGELLLEGFAGNSRFYGHVEVPMWNRALSMGFYHGYLLDYHEESNPVPHDRGYIRWKELHASGQFSGNFDDFVKSEVFREL